ncbi:MAG: NAD(P)-dependent oxidoreductase [Pseudomonadota bacterium]|jgi:3-hydroxyisobutyrate dehydrogenase
METVGFVGLGTMGFSMARNIAAAEIPLVVYNRTAAVSQKLQAECANRITTASTPAELARKAHTVCICVSDDTALDQIIFGAQGLLSASGEVRRIIDFSTVSPATARSIAERCASRGVIFIDAPVTGGDVGARNGTLMVMAGGDEKEVQALQPLFAAVSSRVVYMGPSGAGQLTKCVNQLACAINIAAMSEGLAFAENSGLDLAKVIEVIGSGAAGSWALANYAPRLLRGDLQPGFSVKHQLKDLDIVVRETREMATQFPILSVVRDLYRAVNAAGGSELGNHALPRAYRMKLTSGA